MHNSMKFARAHQRVIALPQLVDKAFYGKYFIGQSMDLNPSTSNGAWAGLFNPEGSGVDLYVNVFTITNFSGSTFNAEVWFGAVPEEPGVTADSTQYSPSNRTILPIREPKCKIKCTSTTTGVPSDGVNVFTRMIGANHTVVSEEDGKIILPPGSSFVIYLAKASGNVVSRIAFGWWEEEHQSH